MIEKSFIPGGTSSRSGGVYWVPNNTHMQQQGLTDTRHDCISFMARCSYPALYDPNGEMFGLPTNNYELLATFYDNASSTFHELQHMGALQFEPWIAPDGRLFPDYHADLVENKAPRGRGLITTPKDGVGEGAGMIMHLHAALQKREIPLLLEQRAEQLLFDNHGRVVGLEAVGPGGEWCRYNARKAVIFATGGFTHNADLCDNHLRGPVFGGCTVPSSEGDFVFIGAAAGAKLANMNHAWWWQVILESALQSRDTSSSVSLPAGDSMILVNCDGKRVVNEKTMYNERTQVHFSWDPVRARYPNLILFAIYDEFTRNRYGEGLHLTSSPMTPAPGTTAPHLLTGETLAELHSAIENRLEELSRHTGNYRLDNNFLQNLEKTIERFNGFAESGVDKDFHRGDTPKDIVLVEGRFPGNDKPNPTMYPISDKGPYYAVLLAAGVLDTKGGPKINALAQVLDNNDQAIPGLYGAGNCIGSPAGQAYWAGGSTLGLAMTFGAIAGKQAVQEPAKASVASTHV